MESKHFNDEQIAVLAEALNANDLSMIDKTMNDHVSVCDECANKVLIVSELSQKIDLKLSMDKESSNKRSIAKYSIVLLAAASIALFFLVFYLQPKNEEKKLAKSSGSSIFEQNEYGKIIPSQNRELLAFAENKKLETIFNRFRESGLRSGEIQIYTHQIIKTSTTKDIKIEWSKSVNSVYIKVYNNKNNEVFSQQTTASFIILKGIEKEGLYYWKVLDEDDNLVYCGKIIYTKAG